MGFLFVFAICSCLLCLGNIPKERHPIMFMFVNVFTGPGFSLGVFVDVGDLDVDKPIHGANQRTCIADLQAQGAPKS